MVMLRGMLVMIMLLVLHCWVSLLVIEIRSSIVTILGIAIISIVLLLQVVQNWGRRG